MAAVAIEIAKAVYKLSTTLAFLDINSTFCGGTLCAQDKSSQEW